MMIWEQRSGRLFVRGPWAVTLVDYVWRVEVPGPEDLVRPYRHILPLDFGTAQQAMIYVDATLASSQAASASDDAAAARSPR